MAVVNRHRLIALPVMATETDFFDTLADAPAKCPAGIKSEMVNRIISQSHLPFKKRRFAKFFVEASFDPGKKFSAGKRQFETTTTTGVWLDSSGNVAPDDSATKAATD